MNQAQVPIPLWRRARRRAYWLLLLGLLKIADHWPLTWGRGSFRLLSRLACRLRPKEMERARRNLVLAFSELSAKEIEALTRKSALALGRNFHDSLAARRVLARSHFKESGPVEGLTLAETVKQLRDQGRGVLFLTGHIGCWELLGAWAAREFSRAGLGELAVVTGTLHNPPINDLVQRRRAALGMKVLPREEGITPLLRHLRDEGLVAILLDQNTRTRNLEVPFFGRPAPTAVGLAQVALKQGLPVIPLGLARVDEEYEVNWLAPLESPTGLEEINEKHLFDFTTRCNESLEILIRRNPSEWVWFHNRWDD